MSIEQQPKVRLQQKQVVEQARQQALKDVQTRMQNLSLQVASLRDPGTWNDVQTVDSGDTTKVTATRTGGAAAGGYSLQIVGLARAAQMTQGTSATAASADDTLHIGVGSTAVDVAVKAGDSLQTIADNINSASSTPVYASLMNGKLVLSGKQTGAANSISVTGGAVATDLGFTETQSAQNADFWVGTNHYTDRASNTITDVMPGVSLTLRGTTGTNTVSVVVGSPGADTDAIQSQDQGLRRPVQLDGRLHPVEAERGRGRQPDQRLGSRQGSAARRSWPREPAREHAGERLGPLLGPGRRHQSAQHGGSLDRRHHRLGHAQPGRDRGQADPRHVEADRAPRRELRRRQVALHEARPAPTTPRACRSGSTATSTRGSSATARTPGSCRRGSTGRSR